MPARKKKSCKVHTRNDEDSINCLKDQIILRNLHNHGKMGGGGWRGVVWCI